MKYDLKIIEYPKMSSVQSSANGVVFPQGNRLMVMRDNEPEVFVNTKNNSMFGYGVVKNGVWISNELISSFYDFKKSNTKALTEDVFAYSSGRFAVDFVAGNSSYDDDDGALFCKHLDSGKVYKGEDVDYVDVDGVNIFTHTVRKRKFTCYDKYLKELWFYTPNKRINMFADRYYLYNDSLIINGIYEEEQDNTVAQYERKSFELVALCKKTGEIKWHAVTNKAPTYSILVDDKFYLYRDDHVIIIDANNGDVLFEKPIGFSSKLLSGAQQEQVSIFQHNDHIFVFGLRNKAIRIFDMEMEFIQEIELPKPNTEHCLDDFTGAPLRFAGYGNNVYCVLQHYTGLNGLTILSPAENNEPQITIRKRPDFQLEKIPETEGHAYKISIDSDNLDEVVSSGEYELMEIAQYCGTDRSEHSHYDPELNDHLIYSVNKSLLPDDAEEDLKLMAERVEIFCETFLVKSAKTGKNFKIKIEFR